MNQVTLCENPIDPLSWTTHDAENVCEFLTDHFIEWPKTARIYHNYVAESADVTPHDDATVEKLEMLSGHFYVVVYPEGIEIIIAIIAIAIAAIAIGLSFLLRPHASPNVKNQQQTSPNNELSNRQNKERPNERIPDIFGKVRSTPDLIAVPYRIFDGAGIEIEYSYMCIGRGSYTLEQVRDDTTPIGTIDGASVQVYGPNTSPNSGAVQLQIGAAIGEPVRSVRPTNAVNGQIQIAPNLTGGGGWTGPFIVGDSNTTDIWLNFVAQSGCYQVAGATGVQTAVSVTIEVGTTPVDASGAAIAGETLATVTLIGSATLKDRVGITLKLVRSGRQAVRAHRTSNTNIAANFSVSDETQWRDCYALFTVAALHFGNVTTVQTLTRPTPAALALKARKLNMLATRNIAVGTLASGAVTFAAPGPTVSAADIIVALAVDPFIGNRDVSELDIVGIYTTVAAVATYFGTNLCTRFCFTFDDAKVSFEESIADVATSIFCRAFRRGSVISLFFEKQTPNSSILFNHRNKLPGSETRTVTFGTPNDTDGIELNYVEPNDPTSPNEDIVLTLFFPPDQSAINPKRITTVGIRNNVQAYLLGKRLFNKLMHQNTVTEFKATEEAAALNLDERILVADNTRPDTQDGEVLDQNVLLITLSQFATLATSRTYTIFLQHYDGTVESIAVTPSAVPNFPTVAPDWSAASIYKIGDKVVYLGIIYLAVVSSTNIVPGTDGTKWSTVVITNQVILAHGPSLPLVLDPNMFALTTYMLVSNVDARSAAFMVAEKLPEAGKIYQLKAINYDDAYYANDTDFITNAILSNGEAGEDSPAIAPGGTYRPTLANDIGVNPTAGLGTHAGTVEGFFVPGTPGSPGPPEVDPTPADNEPGDCIWLGFAPVRISADTTLHVVVSTVTITNGSVSLNLNGTIIALTVTGTYTLVIPALTYLSRVTVEVQARGFFSGGGGDALATITDIFIS